MKIVCILQARMGSTRLPGKSLLPLAGKPMVQNVIERVRRASKLDCVVLAYPLSDYDAFKPILQSFSGTSGVSLGSWASQEEENDLVGRYLAAARAYDADIIVRVCCDNPMIEAECIDNAVQRYLDECFPFYSNTTARVPDDHFVDGIGCEVFSVSRLKWLDRITKGNPRHREHPHLWFYENGAWALEEHTVRLDVNTEEDYRFIESIYGHFGHNRFHITDVLDYLYATQPR